MGAVGTNCGAENVYGSQDGDTKNEKLKTKIELITWEHANILPI